MGSLGLFFFISSMIKHVLVLVSINTKMYLVFYKAMPILQQDKLNQQQN